MHNATIFPDQCLSSLSVHIVRTTKGTPGTAADTSIIDRKSFPSYNLKVLRCVIPFLGWPFARKDVVCGQEGKAINWQDVVPLMRMKYTMISC